MSHKEELELLKNLENKLDLDRDILTKIREDFEKEEKISEILMEPTLVDNVETFETSSQKPAISQYLPQITETVRRIIALQQSMKQFDAQIKIRIEEIRQKYQNILQKLQYKELNLERKTEVILKTLEMYRDAVRNLLITLQMMPNDNVEIVKHKLILVDKINENLKLVSEIIMKYLEI